MMESRKLKVLFVGLGGIGQRHLRNLKYLKGDSVEIYAYRCRKSQFVLDNTLHIIHGEELDKKYDIINVDSLDGISALGIDAAFICNPTSMHIATLNQLLRADCGIFIEKPLSQDMEGIKAAETLIREKDRIVFVGYQNRYHPCIKKAKKLIDSRAIGRVISVRAEIGENVRNWHKYEDYRTMYACRKELGGGVVVTQIHELDYLYHIFGMPRDVHAVGGKLSDLEIDVEDTAEILMTYRVDEYLVPVSVHMDYLQVPICRTCRIIGSDGFINFDLLNHHISVYDANGHLTLCDIYEFDRNDMFLEEMKDFLDSVESKKSSVIPFSEGIKSLEIASYVLESMRSGRIVRVEELNEDEL